MTSPSQAYKALSVAAGRIGAANYRAGRGCITRRTKGRTVRCYAPTPAHQLVMQAMSDVLDGRISPEEAMALLWTWDVACERGIAPAA